VPEVGQRVHTSYCPAMLMSGVQIARFGSASTGSKRTASAMTRPLASLLRTMRWF
jgi:hypothetical protein